MSNIRAPPNQKRMDTGKEINKNKNIFTWTVGEKIGPKDVDHRIQREASKVHRSWHQNGKGSRTSRRTADARQLERNHEITKIHLMKKSETELVGVNMVNVTVSLPN